MHDPRVPICTHTNTREGAGLHVLCMTGFEWQVSLVYVSTRAHVRVTSVRKKREGKINGETILLRNDTRRICDLQPQQLVKHPLKWPEETKEKWNIRCVARVSQYRRCGAAWRGLAQIRKEIF